MATAPAQITPDSPPAIDAAPPEMTTEYLLGLDPDTGQPLPEESGEPTAAPPGSPDSAPPTDTASGTVQYGDQAVTLPKVASDEISSLRAMQANHDTLVSQNATLLKQLQQNQQFAAQAPAAPQETPAAPPPPPVDIAQLSQAVSSIESDIGSAKGTLQSVLNDHAKLIRHQAMEDFKSAYLEPLQNQLSLLESDLQTVQGTVLGSQEVGEVQALMTQYNLTGDPSTILSAADAIQQGWLNGGSDPQTVYSQRGVAIYQGILATIAGSNGTAPPSPSPAASPPAPPGPAALPPRPSTRNVNNGAPQARPSLDVNTMLADQLARGDFRPIVPTQ